MGNRRRARRKLAKYQPRSRRSLERQLAATQDYVYGELIPSLDVAETRIQTLEAIVDEYEKDDEPLPAVTAFQKATSGDKVMG